MAGKCLVRKHGRLGSSHVYLSGHFSPRRAHLRVVKGEQKGPLIGKHIQRNQMRTFFLTFQKSDQVITFCNIRTSIQCLSFCVFKFLQPTSNEVPRRVSGGSKQPEERKKKRSQKSLLTESKGTGKVGESQSYPRFAQNPRIVSVRRLF